MCMHNRDDRRADQSTIDLNNNFFEFAGIFLFFFVFIPLFLWVNCVLMSDWHRMSPNTNNSSLSDTTTDSWTKYYAFDCLYDSGTEIETIVCYARLYYDVQIYMEFIFVVSLFSYVVSKYRKARMYVRKRVLFPWAGNNPFDILPISMSIGEIVFWMLWLSMMITICYYFTVIHHFDNDTDKSALEIWARYIGILTIQFLSFAMFSVTRIRLWHDCFQVSFEHLIAYHRVFGYAFVVCGYLHGILWIVYFNNNDDGYSWSDNKPFGDLPLGYHGSNWTIGMAYQYMIIFVPIFYIVFTFFIIRRQYFELFYYSHVFAAIVTLTFVLWHATQVWRFIIPPLVLYAVDRMIRLYNSSLLCNVEILNANMAGDGNDDDEKVSVVAGTEFTRLSFTIANYNTDHNSAAYRNMSFKCGQYVFVSIGNISMYEWHPFTIASGEYASHVSLYVKNMDVGNNNAWSNLLHELAKSDVPLNDVKLQVDGPYGKPFDYRDYKRVVLVAGGIGITPCHSIFDTILCRSMNGSAVPYVELIWVVRDVSQVGMFLSTWQKYEQNNDANRFHIRIFVTRGNVEESSFQLVVPNTNIMYTQGRPPWKLTLGTLLSNGDITGSESLVFACGPMGLVVDVEQVAVGNGAHFYNESFEF